MQKKRWLAVSAANQFTAGTLCLTSERNDGDRVPGPMFYVTADQTRGLLSYQDTDESQPLAG